MHFHCDKRARQFTRQTVLQGIQDAQILRRERERACFGHEKTENYAKSLR